jgi:hypothetical protein
MLGIQRCRLLNIPIAVEAKGVKFPFSILSSCSDLSCQTFCGHLITDCTSSSIVSSVLPPTIAASSFLCLKYLYEVKTYKVN